LPLALAYALCVTSSYSYSSLPGIFAPGSENTGERKVPDSHDKVPQFYKFNMADGRHNENRFSAISGRFIVWLTRNFARMSITLRHRLR